MSTARYVHWQDGDMWLGYFEEFPDYLTRASRLMNLKRTFVIFTAISRAAKFWASAGLLNYPSDEANRLGSQVGGGRMPSGPSRRAHDWYRNPKTGASQPVPRHREIKEFLAKHILKKLAN